MVKHRTPIARANTKPQKHTDKQHFLPPPKHPPRERKIPHWWVDKRVDRLLRQNLQKRDYRNWKDVYCALCAIESDNSRSGNPIRLPLSLLKNVATYSGMDQGLAGKILLHLRGVGLIDYGLIKLGARGSWFVLFAFDDSAPYRKRLERVTKLGAIKLKELPKAQKDAHNIAKTALWLKDAFIKHVMDGPKKHAPFSRQQESQFKIGAKRIYDFVVSGEFNRLQPYSIVGKEAERDKVRRCIPLLITFLKQQFRRGDPVQIGNLASGKNWNQFLAWLKKQRT